MVTKIEAQVLVTGQLKRVVLHLEGEAKLQTRGQVDSKQRGRRSGGREIQDEGDSEQIQTKEAAVLGSHTVFLGGFAVRGCLEGELEATVRNIYHSKTR